MPSVSLTRSCFGLCLLGAWLGLAPAAQAQIVPGTGNLLNYDDMEDVKWGYSHNFPKSSKEEDENIRYPLGASFNRMWSESPKRGAPDVVKRTETPPGGLPGSTGALYLRTRDCGIPGHPGNKQSQDDFILSARPCGVGYSPNYVVRVFLPEFKDWEQRQGVSFGIRAGMQGMMTSQKPASIGRRLFGGSRMQTVTEMEPYYPGFFIAFNPVSANPAYKEDHAQILIRSDGNGHEVAGPKITQTGWWTFGMSVTPDSRCHYYAHAGIADLTAGDHIYSSLPYGIRGDHFNTIFFNVCSADNGSSWSTPWVIDDPKVFYSGQPVMKPAQPQQAQQPQPVKTAAAPSNVPNTQNASQSKEIPANPNDPVVQTPVQPGAPVPVPMPNPMPVPMGFPNAVPMGVPAPMPMPMPMPGTGTAPMTIPMTPPVAPMVTTPAATTPAPLAPAQAPPVLTPATPAPIPATPATPLQPVPVAPVTPVITPAPVSTAPALLSTGAAVLLKPVTVTPGHPLRIPASTPVSPDTAPAAPGPLLILPVTPAAEAAKAQPTVSSPVATVAPPATVSPPQSNPFDDVQTPNAKSEVAQPVSAPKPATDSGSDVPAALPEEEPPLVISGESTDSPAVDPAPVPVPPSE